MASRWMMRSCPFRIRLTHSSNLFGPLAACEPDKRLRRSPAPLSQRMRLAPTQPSVSAQPRSSSQRRHRCTQAIPSKSPPDQWPCQASRNPKSTRSGPSKVSPSIWTSRHELCGAGSMRATSWPIVSGGRCGSRIVIGAPFWRRTEMFKECHFPSSRVIT